MGGHEPRRSATGTRLSIRARSARTFTLRGLVAELAGRGLKVDYGSVWNFVHTRSSVSKKSVVAASANGPTSREGGRNGRSVRTRSSPSVSCSLMRPGRRPIWSRFAAGRRGRKAGGQRSPRPLENHDLVAALRCDRIEAPWLLDGPINGDAFKTYVEQCSLPPSSRAIWSSWTISAATKAAPSASDPGGPRQALLPAPLLS